MSQRFEENFFLEKMGLGKWVILAVIFGFAYTQLPMYASNQNQYLLHGYAESTGELSSDWLANTADPTPVFSAFVKYNLMLFPEGIFYVYQLILAGLYLFCLVRISLHCFPLSHSRWLKAIFIGLLIFAHAAVLDEITYVMLGFTQEHLFTRGLKAQWLLGRFFQPSAFGVLLLFSLHLFLQKRYLLATALLPLTATIHPTYLLMSGLLTIGYMVSYFISEKSTAGTLKVGFTALLLVLPILAYTFLTFGDESRASLGEAQSILVNFRIPHHIIDNSWGHGEWFYLRIALMIGGLYVVRKKKLFVILAVLFGGGFLLTIAKLVFDSNFIALLFPWRVSTLLVPLSIALILAWALRDLHSYGGFRRAERIVFFQCWISVGFAALLGGYMMFMDYRDYHNDAAMPVMQHVKENLQPGEVYLIPGGDLQEIESFRLETGAPILVDFKSIPYKSADVFEWHARIRQVRRLYGEVSLDMAALEAVRRDHEITHLLVPHHLSGTDTLGTVEFEDDVYRLLKLH